MASTLNFQAGATSQLSGSLAGCSGGQIQDDNTYRRYRAGLTLGVYEQGSYSHNRRSIFYEVGRRAGRLTEALAYQKDGEYAVPIDASVAINPAQAANFEGWARRYSNFSPQWEMMDLAGIVERLAKGVACQSVYGAVSTQNLRAGQPIRVVALGTLDSPQTASVNSVFIPRTVDTVGNDHVFAVLAAAANGEGSTVTTDVLRLDANTNQPIVPTVAGPPLATACVEALRVLGANMDESGAGDVFAYALTRGIHSVVSVVAHTDEGGWIRGIFRHGTFRVPYGGINQSLRDYPGLPPLAATEGSACSAWVDAIALKTAAAVAHCDPCTVASGGSYPTVFTAATGPVGLPGTVEVAEDGDSLAIGRQIAADSGRFTPLYTRALLAIFGLTSNSGVAEAFLCAVIAGSLGNTDDRHLRHKTVAPYFWIEPTSLIPAGAFGTEAERSGFAALVTPGREAEMPTFEVVEEFAADHHSCHATIGFKMRTARTSGLVCAYAGAPAPLADIHLYQFDDAAVVLAGDNGPTPGTVANKHAAADPLSSYLWTRGQSALPAPAEFINTQGSYAAKYTNVTWDEDFDAQLGLLPEAWELRPYPVRLRTSVPTAIANGRSNAGDTGARRARSRAAIALAQAVIRNRGYGSAAVPVMAISSVPPLLGASVLGPAADTVAEAHSPNPGPPAAAGGGRDPRPATVGRGAPLNPVPHHQPLRGAPFLRVGGGNPGGVPPPGGPRRGGPGGAAAGQPPPPRDPGPADDGADLPHDPALIEGHIAGPHAGIDGAAEALAAPQQ